MAIKNLLVPLDGTDVSIKKLPTAYAVAERLGAHLDVLYLRHDTRTLPFVFGAIAARELRDTVQRAATEAHDQRRRDQRRHFDTFCAERSINVLDSAALPGDAPPDAVSASWREDEHNALAGYARLADLVCVIRTPSDEQPWLLEATLLHTPSPVLLVPPQTPDTLTGPVTIGWNDSNEAARAVHAALPLLSHAERAIVLFPEHHAASADALCRYLRQHEIDASPRQVDATGRAAGPALLAETAAVGAGLLVAGAYSRTRASQLLFGGVTQHLVEHANVPVLLAH